MAELLALRGLSKRFGKVTVADNLNLSFDAGNTLGIVGPNGAGKSTLFAMISGDLRPDSGTVLLDGHNITSLKAHRRCHAGIGRTYQIPRPFEKMTVFENALVCVRQGARIRGKPAASRAVETLERCGLLEHANVIAGSLPLLLRKRLEIARGLATNPKLLLLDEVAGGLTSPEVTDLVALITAIHQDGMAIIWIEHVVRALVQTVGRMACLAGGELIADGTPQEVLANSQVRELYLGQAPGGSVDAA